MERIFGETSAYSERAVSIYELSDKGLYCGGEDYYRTFNFLTQSHDKRMNE